MGGVESPPRRAKRIGRPSRRVGKGWEALPKSQVGLGGPGEVGMPCRRDGRVGSPSWWSRMG